jgi:hypothetical protein
MKRLLAVLVASLIGSTLLAQEVEPLQLPTGFEPLAITFPVPAIYVSGELPIVGTVNVAGLNNYFVEIRELRPVAPGAPEAPWTPATLPSRVPVMNSVITVLDTTLFPDGLYEIRLAVTTGTSRDYFRVSPIRIVNDPMSVSPYLALMMAQSGSGGGGSPAVMPTPTTPALSFPTAAPTQPPPAVFATPTLTGPYVQSFVNANVRQGDSTAYPIVGSLPNGSTAPIIGISTTGSGWYYIQLPNGVRGFISPTTVTAVGNTVGVPPVAPPPPPPTATPTTVPPTSTPTATLFPMITPTPSATATITPTASPTLIIIPPVLTLIPLVTPTPGLIFPVTLIAPLPVTVFPIPTLVGP